MNKLILLLLWLLPMSLCAQTSPSPCTEDVYRKALGNPAYDVINGRIVDAGNNSIIFGVYMDQRTNAYSEQAVIFKLKNGVKQWELTFSGKGGRWVADMIKCKDGNFLAFIGAGGSSGVGDADYILLKFDTNGNIIWQKDYKTADPINGVGNVREDTDGSFIVTYKIDQYNLSFYDRIYYAKFDASGKFLFSKIYYNDKNIWLNIIDTHDMYVKDGYTYLCAGYHTYYQMEGLLLKINNANGNVEWSKSYDVDGGPLEFYNIFPYKNNTLCISGYDASYNSYYSDTARIFVVDMQGKPLSMKYYAAAEPRKLRPGTAAMDSSGMLFMSDWFFNGYGDQRQTLTKLDPLGDVLWSKHYPSADYSAYFKQILPTDNSLTILGNNVTINESIINLEFFKMTTDGEFGCPSEPVNYHLQNTTSTPEDAGVVGVNYPTVAVVTNGPTVTNVIQEENISCDKINACNNITLSADQIICHSGDTAVLQFSKNEECASTPSFVFDNEYFTQIDVNGTTARFKALKAGKSSIKAVLTTTCNNVSDEIELKIMDNPSALELGNDTSLCEGNTTVITADKRFKKFVWQDNSTLSSIKISVPGKYYLTAFDSCDNIYSDTIIVNTKPAEPLNLTSHISLCEDDSATITAADGFIKYTWSNNYAISGTNSRSVKIAPSVDTAYYLAAEKTPGCFSYDTVNVKVMLKMPVGLRSDTTLCTGDSVLVKANNGFASYVWSTGEKTQQIYVKKQGSYSITAIDKNSCISKDTFALQNVFDLPVVNLNKDAWICEGFSKVLKANTGYIKYLWNTGSISSDIQVNTVGTYWVSVTDKNLCTSTDTVLIKEIKPAPRNFLPGDTTFCKYKKFNLSSVTDFVSYNWNTGEQTKNITPTQGGTYIAKVTDQYGCEGKDTVTLTSIDCLIGIFFPNAFSPNGDGKNEVFKPIVYTTLVKYEFSIYNRFGNKIFETTNPEQGWDGAVNGMPQNSGNFVWICKYQVEGESPKVEKGYALLLR